MKPGVQNPPTYYGDRPGCVRNVDAFYISSGLDNITEEKDIRHWRWDAVSSAYLIDYIDRQGV